ncbi:hypothetical protein J5N97_028318 [Dioscorea zingiberensis]|uniref:VAN3-binding protein-like auxin canalisation domain-containing protein n=1 Tax=Dioscorea zingiberensis TaxID=325984 RepID=A0A9D5H4Q6_9LILI|nr:hypothetical protein J5N97_028318 [Dioscorea zingiberensis]
MEKLKLFVIGTGVHSFFREAAHLVDSTEVVGHFQKKRGEEFKIEDGDLRAIPQVKFNDLKSWWWLQQAIHPEPDYDIGFREKWFSHRINPNWKGISIKKWMKEIKQKRKEKDRLQRAEFHAKVSVARLATSLTDIEAENAIPNRTYDSKETAVAAATTLVAAQCAQVAEAVGAHCQLLESEISNAMTAADTNDMLGFVLLALIWEYDFPSFMLLSIAILNDGKFPTV